MSRTLKHQPSCSWDSSNVSFAWHGNLAGQVAFFFFFFFGREIFKLPFPVAVLHLLVQGRPMLLVFASVTHHYQGHDMTSCCWLVVMDSERFACPIMQVFCGGLNAYCMHITPLFLRTSGSSGVLRVFLLERNGQLSCNPKKEKKKKNSNSNSISLTACNRAKGCPRASSPARACA